MEPGSYVDPEEEWTHHLLKPEELDQNNMPVLKAFKKFFEPSSPEKAWRHELSGRLVSLAASLVTFAEESATQHRSTHAAFQGLLYCSVGEIKAGFGHSLSDMDVVYTPRCFDSAHADMVKFSEIPAHEYDEYGTPSRLILRALQKKLVFHAAGSPELDALEKRCGSALS